MIDPNVQVSTKIASFQIWKGIHSSIKQNSLVTIEVNQHRKYISVTSTSVLGPHKGIVSGGTNRSLSCRNRSRQAALSSVAYSAGYCHIVQWAEVPSWDVDQGYRIVSYILLNINCGSVDHKKLLGKMWQIQYYMQCRGRGLMLHGWIWCVPVIVINVFLHVRKGYGRWVLGSSYLVKVSQIFETTVPVITKFTSSFLKHINEIQNEVLIKVGGIRTNFQDLVHTCQYL